MTSNTILIIDPDREFAESTKEFLLSQGYRVSLAFNGNQAIKKISSDPPLLALLSLELHGMDSGNLLKKIHEIVPSQVILFTGLGKENEGVDLLNYGVLDYFPKPIENAKLLMAIKDVSTLFKPRSNDPGQEAGSSLHQFFPFLIHELRNPLQAIGGAVSIIEKRSNLKDKALIQSLRIIREEVQYLSGFVQKCLDFIRPLNKNFWIEIDLNELILQCVKMITYMYQEAIGAIKIDTHFDPYLPKVYANYEEIKEALLNLLKNSIEAMDQSPSKELTIKMVNKTHHDSGWVDIIIGDNGSGIKKENINNLGIPFFTTKLRGTGLGLAICHKIIVDRHKGKMMIESEEGKGTTITLRLPVNALPRNPKDKDQ
ncbi:MAG: ATP-binding protein [Thermodesulfobacteriota bacterium]